MAYRDMEKKRRYETRYRHEHRDRRKQQRQAKIDRMIGYLGGRCAECDAWDNLEFHHIDPSTKSFNPRAKALMKWEILVPELNKCRLLCDACHKSEHATSHGTVTMYVSHKCRCEKCKDAIRRYRGHEEFKPAQHGSRTMYRNGCRCDSCTNAQSIYAKSYYHDRKQQEKSCQLSALGGA
jgi:hypothetical protein